MDDRNVIQKELDELRKARKQKWVDYEPFIKAHPYMVELIENAKDDVLWDVAMEMMRQKVDREIIKKVTKYKDKSLDLVAKAIAEESNPQEQQ